VIHLKNKYLQASLDPNGACLTSFETNHHQAILRDRPPGQTDPILSACFPCLPFFGRIAHALTWEGQTYPLRPTHQAADQHHAIHGEGWINHWVVSEQTDTRALLSYKADKDTQSHDGLFPFSYEAEQVIELHPDRLKITLTLINQHNEQAPFGMGLHPFFIRSPSTQLNFHYDEIHTPPNFIPLDAAKLPFSKGLILPQTLIDHSFIGSNGTVYISDNKHHNYQLEFDAPYLHIYAPPHQDYFCLEPITQLPGAFDHANIDSSHILKKGGAKTITMSIKISPASLS